MTGSQNTPSKEQLQNFANQLQSYSKSPTPISPPANWSAAFHQLSSYLDAKKFSQKMNS